MPGRWKNRPYKCECGKCPTCYKREWSRKKRRGVPSRRYEKSEKYAKDNKDIGPDIDMGRLNSYWDKVRTA